MDAHVMHDEFLAAPERAWRYACRRVIVDKLPFNPRLHDLRWHLAGFPEGAGAPLTGGSLGGAFGIAALRFVRGEHVDSRCAVTGALDPTWQPNSDAPMRLLPIIGEAEKLNAAFPPAEGVEPEFAVAETAADGVRLFDGSHRGRDVGVRRVVFPEACRTIARDLAGQAGLDVDLAVAFAGTLDDVLSRTDAYDDDRRFRGDAFDVLRRARQQPFLHRYLGPTTAFGGRDAEFALLDEFLRSGGSPGRSRAPRRLLLTGQGGAGKSALLCRWQARVRDGFVSVADADQREWAVIHVPISRRDDTNRADQVHRTLALELSLLYGERIAQPDQVPSHAWRDFVTTWLTNPPPCGRRVLVILDGLDELVGRESLPNCLQFGFPPQPPEWLRIVAAARCAEHDDQWAKALRWFAAPQAIRRHLEYLTRDQIRALLLAEEIPYANSPDELTDRLFTLTRGRPLVLQRYLSLLRSEQHSLFHLTPADLATLTPARMHEYDAASTDHDSLATLFTFWSERLEDSFGARARDLTTAARNLLGVLAMGLGPLNETDWRRLAGVETAPTSYAFNDALTAVKFFVEEVPSLDLGGLTRAAPAESAWTYQHPEFAVHLLLHSGWYRPADVAAFEQLYLMWGEACLRGLDSNSPSVPGYVQSYYSLHIEQANQLTDAERLSRLTRLLDADWCEAWQRYTSRDDYSGYLADVARAAAVARQLNEAHKTLAKGEAPFFPHFSIECRIELIRASIRTLQAKIPPELVAALFRAGDWTAAQTFQVLDAAMATKDFSRAAKLVHLLTSALDASRIDGHCFLNRLVNVARSIDYPQLRARVLAAIVRQLPTHEALDVGRSIDRPYWRARALASVGKRLPLRGAVEIRREAVNLARSIHSPYSRGRALAEIVEQLPFDEVVEIRREAL
ncbi:MAG TPA: hypothetical protein VGE52_16420, partial [Pirellulales bacterium]